MASIQRIKHALNSLTTLLRRQKKTLLLVAIVAATTLLLSALAAIWLNHSGGIRFPSVGTIRTSGLKAYWDADLTNETKEIPWGQLYPGSASNVTLYLRSISNMPVTLEVIAANWTLKNSLNEIVYGPAGSIENISLSWDYDGSVITSNQAIPVVFTLHLENTPGFVKYVIEKDVQEFSFDINVHALEENTR